MLGASGLHRGGFCRNGLPSTAIDGAGVFTSGVTEQALDFVRSFRPMARVGALEDVANAAEYLAGDLAGFVSGQHPLLSGGAPA